MDYAAPYRGNFIPSLMNLAYHMDKANVDIAFLLPETARNIPWVVEFQKERKRVWFMDRSFFSKKIRFVNILKIREIIRRENIGIVHTHFLAYNYSLLLLKLFFLRKVRFIGNFMNEYVIPRNKWFGLKVMVTRLTFDKFVASSDGVKKSLFEAGISPEKIVAIFNSLDPHHLNIDDKIDFRKNSDEKIVLMFGWTFFRKGVDIAISAVRELTGEGIKIRLVIAMAGGMDLIEAEIKKITGIIPDWITLKGPAQNIATYYNAADIFLSSSREEGFTYSVLEAAYCNPMIIMSRIAGHPLDIPFAESFTNGNISDLKKCISKTLSIPSDEKEKIKKTQMEYVISEYDINKWSYAMLNEYSKLF